MLHALENLNVAVNHLVCTAVSECQCDDGCIVVGAILPRYSPASTLRLLPGDVSFRFSKLHHWIDLNGYING